MRRVDQARPFLTLGVVLLAWLILPTFFKRVARLSFYELQAPVDIVASYARDLQDFWSQRTRTKSELIEASRDLARLNASYELRLAEEARLRAEITRLEELLRLPSFEKFRSEPARVARRDFGAWWQRMVIRKGANHGLRVGAPVIYVGGLVGRAAVFEGDDRPVSVQGGVNPPLAPAEGLLEFVPIDLFATPTAPRRIFTSGLGGVYPPGLYIGEAWQLEPSTDGLFKTGRARLDPRLSRLTEVTVLVPLGTALPATVGSPSPSP